MRTMPSYIKTAYLLTALILLIFGASVYALAARPKVTSATAYVYKEGLLVRTFDLGALTEPTIIRIEGSNGDFNDVLARPGSIGVLDASCPHKYCAEQGMSEGSLLPIICLPNRLVIEIYDNAALTDAITY